MPTGRSRALLMVRVAVIAAIIPVLAWAASDARPAWTGVYSGRGSAKALGSSYSRAVTVFATQKDGQVELLIQVAGTSASAKGMPQILDEDTILVPFTVSEGGIEGSGEAMFERKGGAWTLSATGEGSAFGFAGEGGLTAKQRKTRMPTVTEQVAGTVKALGGAMDQSHVPPPTQEPPTVTEPPQPTEPVSTSNTALEYLFWALMLIVLVFG